MNPQQMVFLTTVILGTGGLVLLLHPGWGWMRVLGAGLGAMAFGMVLGQAPVICPILEGGLFYFLAVLTVGTALAAISLVHPVYSAVCFGLSLVGVSGLMAYGGAEFLAAATLIVYVGAILVVLLFVLMLAHPRGRASYDWNRWEVFVSVGTGMVLLSLLSMMITRTLSSPEQHAFQTETQTPSPPVSKSSPPVSKSQTSSASEQEPYRPPKAGHGVLAEAHVARIGQHLYGTHWLGVQAAGVLLLAALVGAAVLIGRRPTPGQTPTLSGKPSFRMSGPPEPSGSPSPPKSGTPSFPERG